MNQAYIGICYKNLYLTCQIPVDCDHLEHHLISESGFVYFDILKWTRLFKQVRAVLKIPVDWTAIGMIFNGIIIITCFFLMELLGRDSGQVVGRAVTQIN